MKKTSLYIVIALLAACKAMDSRSVQDSDGTILNKEVAISYRSAGAGDTTLLFVHGWCIDKTYWNGQVEYFAPRYQVVTIDLPGFGKSGRNRKDWTIEEYGKDVVAVIDQLRLKKVILIGHSMGGDIILEAAVTEPERVIGFIGIDNFQEIAFELTPGQLSAAMEYFDELEKDFAAKAPAYAEQYLFQPGTDSAVRKRVTSDFRNSDPKIAMEIFRSLASSGARERTLLPLLTQKVVLVNSDANPTNKESLKELCGASFEVIDIHATGHYPMIEKPDEFNKLLQIAIRATKN